MGYKIFASMNIAIIGCSEVAVEYSARLSMMGHNVYLASKNEDCYTADKLSAAFDNVYSCSIAEAAEMADLVIIATPPGDVREVSYWLGDIRRKVVIDASCNFIRQDEETVNTVLAIGAITGCQQIVKVFFAKGFEQLLEPLFKATKIDVIMAGGSKKAKELAKIILKDVSIEQCYDFGGSDTLPLFNEMTRCWSNLARKTGSKSLISTVL